MTVEMTTAIVMRALHLLCVAVIVGGLGFVVFCAPLAKRWLENDSDFKVLKRIERRLRWLMAMAVLGLIVSGLYTWMVMGAQYKIAGSGVQIMLGIKVVLASILIAVLWAQDVGLMVAPSAWFWRMVCVVLGCGVILLGATVRQIRLEGLLHLLP